MGERGTDGGRAGLPSISEGPAKVVVRLVRSRRQEDEDNREMAEMSKD